MVKLPDYMGLDGRRKDLSFLGAGAGAENFRARDGGELVIGAQKRQRFRLEELQ